MSRMKDAGLTPAQLEVMQVIWAEGEVGVAEVWKQLSGRRALARNTVQTTLSRLHEKGWLRARADGNALRYSAVRPRASVLSRMVNRLVDTAFHGSASGLMAAVVGGRRLTREEVEAIRKLIDEAEQNGKGQAR